MSFIAAHLALLSPSHANTVDFDCVADEGGKIVGVAPVTIFCTVVPPAEGTFADVSWTFGDGTLAYGDTVSYEYNDPGQYTVSVRLEDFEGTAGAAEDEFRDPREIKHGYVTVCSEPEPEFTYFHKGGLDIQILNRTPVTVNCVDSLRWELFRGDASGEPVRTWEVWEPRFELPEPGRWTLRLTMNGLAGTGAAELTLDETYRLTEDLTKRSAPACATGVAPAGWIGGVGWVAVFGLLWRRRR